MENHRTPFFFFFFFGSSNWLAHSFPPNMANFHGANIYGSAVGFDASLEKHGKFPRTTFKMEHQVLGRKQSRTTSFPENFDLQF